MKAKTSKQKEMRKHFIQALYDTLENVVSPTPYLEIREGDNVDVRFLNGKAMLPMPNTTEVTVLDIDVASLFFDDFHILYEGVTGVGKTYTSDALFNAVFGPDGHYTIRLSGGVLGSSALEPFTTTTLENGVPKTRIDPEKCQKYGALFIDEINRGDSQEVFQVVDSVVHVNGDTGYLRIPIPGQEGKYKGLAIIAAGVSIIIVTYVTHRGIGSRKDVKKCEGCYNSCEVQREKSYHFLDDNINWEKIR